MKFALMFYFIYDKCLYGEKNAFIYGSHLIRGTRVIIVPAELQVRRKHIRRRDRVAQTDY